MTTSSQQPDYSTILISDPAIDSTLDTITISSADSSYYSSQYDFSTSSIGTITLTGSSGATYTVPSMSGSTISFPSNFDNITIGNLFPEEFVNGFPDWNRVEQMCKLYPGLEIALKKFREVYTMVKDDYDALKNQDNNT